MLRALAMRALAMRALVVRALAMRAVSCQVWLVCDSALPNSLSLLN